MGGRGGVVGARITSKRGGVSRRAGTSGRGVPKGSGTGVTRTAFSDATGVGEEAGGVGGRISTTLGAVETAFRRLRDSVAGGVGSRRAEDLGASRRDTGRRVAFLVQGAPWECSLRRFVTGAWLSSCSERGSVRAYAHHS
jgi:hypothetical protein